MAVELDLSRDFRGLPFGLEMDQNHTLGEREILSHVKAGDKRAYERIVLKYMKRAYFIALCFVHNHEDALDISQEAFIRAYRRMRTFDLRRPFFPWFYEILKNLCLDHLRHRHQKKEIPLDGSTVIRTRPEDREMKATLWKAINSLPPDQREIILLRYFQQLSYREIAELTNKPVGSVMSGLFYARMKLKETLGHFMALETKASPKRGPDGP